MTQLNERGRRYLDCIQDWKAAFEVAVLLGDNPPVKKVSATLHGLVGRGLAERHSGNNTFRLTDAGRLAISSQDHGGAT